MSHLEILLSPYVVPSCLRLNKNTHNCSLTTGHKVRFGFIVHTTEGQRLCRAWRVSKSVLEHLSEGETEEEHASLLHA